MKLLNLVRTNGIEKFCILLKFYFMLLNYTRFKVPYVMSTTNMGRILYLFSSM